MASSPELTPEQERRKEEFIADVGYWIPAFDLILERDPAFFEVYRDWATYPMESEALDPKTRELILVAVYSQTTHRQEAGMRRHIGRAFEAGASFDEVFEVLQIASVLGIHSYMLGAKIMDEKLDIAANTPDEVIESFLDDFEEKRGYRPDWWDHYIAPDPGFFREYLGYSTHPWEHGTLEPKTREFLYIAIDATPAHLLDEGIAAHMDNAIELGATREELAAVFQLTSLLSFDTMTDGVPILVEEAAERGKLEE